MAALACVVTMTWVLGRGFSARDKPTAVEAFVARYLRHFAVPRAARTMENPVPATPAVLAEARAHFADHCAICHGNDGRGQTPIGRNLYPKAPDMTISETQSLSDGELFYIIHNGVRLTGMPAWGGDDPGRDLDSWKLVHFVRHLPNITAAELEEMRALNPRTREELEEEEKIRKFLEGKPSPPTALEHKH
jgi:mono/diheme cytochrome c family protein